MRRAKNLGIAGLIPILLLGMLVNTAAGAANQDKALLRLLRLVSGYVKQTDFTMRLKDTSDSILLLGLLESAGPLDLPSNRDYVVKWADFHIKQHDIKILSPDRAVVGLVYTRLFEITKYQQFFLAADRILNITLRGLQRLKDGTIISYGQGQIRIDSLFELVPFIMRMGKVTKIKSYRDEALKQLRQIRNLTRDAGSSFSRHAYDAATKKLSPEVYGKGNAMAAAAMADVLSLMPKDDINRASLMPDFIFLMTAALKAQDPKTGLWRILPQRPETPVDAAATGLFLFAMLRGLDKGFLSKATFAPAARKACVALMGLVDKSGRVNATTGTMAPGKYEDYRMTPIGAYPDGAGAFLLAGAEALKTGFKCK